MAAVIRKYHPTATATMWSKLFNKRYAAKKRATTSTSEPIVLMVAGTCFLFDAGASVFCVWLFFVISSFDLSLFVDSFSVAKNVMIVNTFLYFHSVNSGRSALMILRKCPLCHCWQCRHRYGLTLAPTRLRNSLAACLASSSVTNFRLPLHADSYRPKLSTILSL